MNEDEAIKIAKNKKSTAEQLKALVGVSDKVDLLLAKHPNTSTEMLEEICNGNFLDEKICSACLAHPNISVEELLNSGWEYSSAMFRNPKLPSIMQSQKNFLGEFDGEEFENSFKKEIPDFVVEWLLSRGKAIYQLAYVSAPKRSPEELLKFRQSKHPKVVSVLLDKDIDTYRTWATDVGFEVDSMNQLSVSEARDCIDRLVSRVAQSTSDETTALDDQPKSLALPAELSNVLLRIESTFLKSGRITLPPDQTFYEDFVDALQTYFTNAQPLSNLVEKLVEYDLSEVKRFCNPGKKPPSGIDTAAYYVKSGLRRSFHRLMAALAGSCQRQHMDYWTNCCTQLEGLVSANPQPSAAVKASLDGNITPPIPSVMLDKQGKFDIGSMFSNEALKEVVSSDATFLAGFKGPKFEKILSVKKVPDFVVDWLVVHGGFEQQASFLFVTNRGPEVTARFRDSKHLKVVSQLLLRDDATYLAWANALGFEAPSPCDDEPVAVRSNIDVWVENLDGSNAQLWKFLVPAQGAATSIQGELVRAIGRLQTEYFRNGMMNWGDGGGHYEAFTDLVHRTLKSEASFPKIVKTLIDADVQEIKQVGKEGRAIARGKATREQVFGQNFLIANDVEMSMQRLGALIAIWCQRHPELIPYTV